MNEEFQVANEELETAEEEIQSVNADISDLNAELERKARDLARASNDMKNLLESTQTPTLFLDRNLNIRSFTPAITELFSVLEQDRGRPLSDIARSFEYEGLTTTLLRVLDAVRGEECQVNLNGKWYVMRLVPYRSDDRVIDGVTITFTDVTELKKAEAEVERARYERELQDMKQRTDAELRRAERLAALGTFAAGLGHELNNPLSTISMSADYALRTSEPDKLNKMLVAIAENAKRCSRIVEGVMRFARDESSKKWNNDLSAITAAAVDLARAYLPAEKLDLALDLARDLPQVSCNPTQIEQVVVNLIRNACEASARLASVSVRTEKAGAGVRLSVEDNGPGIPPDHLPKIFDPFHSTRRNKGGTGLGLSIAHRVVTDHGGTIHAFNRPQGGAAFVVELPAARNEAGGNGRGD
jgi:two-component system CheB/CheR fusion protein